MPWRMETRGDEVVVVREGGKVVGRHKSKKDALAHLRALYAVEKGRFASRSEAARYAAQQRWKGHVAEEPTQGPVDRVAQIKEMLEGQLGKTAKQVTEDFAKRGTYIPSVKPEMYDTHSGVGMVQVVGLPTDKTEFGFTRTGVAYMPSPEVMRLEQQVRDFGKLVMEEIDEGREEIESRMTAAHASAQSEMFKLSDLETEFQQVYQKTLETDRTMSQIKADIHVLETERQKIYAAAQAQGKYFQEIQMMPEYREITEKLQPLYSGRRAREDNIEGQVAQEILGQPLRNLRQQIQNLSIRMRANSKLKMFEAISENRRKNFAALCAKLGVSVGQERFNVAKADGASVKKVQKLMADVASVMPDALVKMVNGKYGTVYVKGSRGGGYWSEAGVFKVDKRIVRAPVIQTDETVSTNLHEFTHAVSYSNRFVRLMETAFLSRRRVVDDPRDTSDMTIGDKMQENGVERMQIKGKGGRGSYYIVDHFVDPYAGRTYGGETMLAATESITRGVEYAFANQHSAEDAEHIGYTLGTLLLAAQKAQ